MQGDKKSEISNEKRRLIISNYKKGKKLTDIAKTFDVNYNSIKTIINRYNKSGCIKIKARSGRPKKIDSRRGRLIIRELKKNRRSTKRTLLNNVNKNQNIKISTCT